VGTAKHDIDFVGFAARQAQSGGMAATKGYRFKVNGSIIVTGWASAFPGKLSDEDVEQKAKRQIEQVLDNGDVLKDGEQFDIRL